MPRFFQTISAPSTCEYKEKGSKFHSYAFPVKDEIEVKDTLNFIQKEHPKSRHICYAYLLGADKQQTKAHDDGEPNHSAGTPILNQIKSSGLTNILVVVVRYFGGTKLGLPGLIHAYKTAASDALNKVIAVEDYEKTKIELSISYPHIQPFMEFVRQPYMEVIVQEFGEICNFTLQIPLDDKQSIIEVLNKMPTLNIQP